MTSRSTRDQVARARQRLQFIGTLLVHHRQGIRFGHRLAPAAPAEAERGAEANELEAYFDEHAAGPGIWKWRHYFEPYHRHLQGFRGRPVHMVEIGVYGGGSLGMWRHYLGPEALIYGVDIDPAARALAAENVSIFIGDQQDPEFWADFRARVPRVDIVLDDGGHTFRQQVTTLEALLGHLRPGGVYLCEDITGIANPFFDYVMGLARHLNNDQPFEALPEGEARVQPAPAQRVLHSVHVYPFLVAIETRARPVTFEIVRRGSDWPSA